MSWDEATGRVTLLLGLLLAFGACGGKKNPAGSASVEGAAFLVQHNARLNNGRTVRWPNLPIPVFANDIAREDEVREWTSVSGGRVTFAFVGSPSASGISVRFRSGADICGVTTVEYNSDGAILSADVRVSRDVFRSSQCVRTVTHEIGHAIGVLDHTSDGGLMDEDGGDGRITSPVAEMIRTLYSLPPGTLVALGEKPQTALRRSGERYSVTFVYPVRR